MTSYQALIGATIRARSAGHSGLFSTADLALLMQRPKDVAFSRFLSAAVRAGVLNRVCRNIYVNLLAEPEGKGILAKIAMRMHWDKFIYISLESQLSYLGVISQVMMNRITVMTTGRSNIITSSYGVIEFTHTKNLVEELKAEVYWDTEIGIFRAKEARAIQDLKRVGRNLHMLDVEKEVVDAE
jgi:hypothetical protein